ncbi:MAG: substrate-binding domain-containing protein [Candidatus Heritagella sp.]|nr:substrate-binding domain-containing protein [Candidatus Heritagella sp.]
MKTKKWFAMALACMMAVGSFAGCSSSETTSAADDGSSAAEDESSAPDSSAEETTGLTGDIHVLSREDGSGTRGAFIELLGIEEKDADGNKVDKTIASAEITNSTAVMMQTVAGDKAAIGYISLGSLDDSVKALKIDGVEATTDNVKNGSYSVSRPFNIVTKEETTEVAADFIAYILSEDGQKVVEDNGYVSEGNTGAYQPSGLTGTITVAGSSSVTPVMEKLAEAYQALNSGVEIKVQQSDSTTGVTSAADGLCDIGMASRELKGEETALGIHSQKIAMDGIAVIVNNENPLEEIAAETVKGIYVGETTGWEEVK